MEQGGGAGRADEHVVGCSSARKWTEGNRFTENGVIVDGRLSKLGSELIWEYDWDDPDATVAGRRSRVVSSTSSSRRGFDKHTKVDASADLGSETHQVFGTWSGRIVTDDGSHSSSPAPGLRGGSAPTLVELARVALLAHRVRRLGLAVEIAEREVAAGFDEHVACCSVSTLGAATSTALS